MAPQCWKASAGEALAGQSLADKSVAAESPLAESPFAKSPVTKSLVGGAFAGHRSAARLAFHHDGARGAGAPDERDRIDVLARRRRLERLGPDLFGGQIHQ